MPPTEITLVLLKRCQFWFLQRLNCNTDISVPFLYFLVYLFHPYHCQYGFCYVPCNRMYRRNVTSPDYDFTFPIAHTPRMRTFHSHCAKYLLSTSKRTKYEFNTSNVYKFNTMLLPYTHHDKQINTHREKCRVIHIKADCTYR